MLPWPSDHGSRPKLGADPGLEREPDRASTRGLGQAAAVAEGGWGQHRPQSEHDQQPRKQGQRRRSPHVAQGPAEADQKWQGHKDVEDGPPGRVPRIVGDA